MNLKERAQGAHRQAFALITTALSNPEEVDLDSAILDYANDTGNPVQALIDVSQVLVWHAAGAILTHSGGTAEALALVQGAALQQETHFGEGHEDE